MQNVNITYWDYTECGKYEEPENSHFIAGTLRDNPEITFQAEYDLDDNVVCWLSVRHQGKEIYGTLVEDQHSYLDQIDEIKAFLREWPRRLKYIKKHQLMITWRIEKLMAENREFFHSCSLQDAVKSFSFPNNKVHGEPVFLPPQTDADRFKRYQEITD